MKLTDSRVRDLMSTELLSIEHNDSLQRADELMRTKRVRHLLAVDDEGLLQGVLSQRDVYHGGLLKALGFGTRAREQTLASLRVKDAMTASPVTTTPGTLLRDAACVMLERKIGCLPVLDGERLVGILTEGDFVRVVARDATEHDT